MTRPEPPEGFGPWEAVEEGVDWTADQDDVREVAARQGCRYSVGRRFGPGVRRSCGEPVAAVFFRGRTGRAYGYCAAHLYGRWLEDGRVMTWRRVRS